MGRENPWLGRYRPSAETRLRLICLPYAGGGTVAFRDWSRELPKGVEVVAVCLPGREARIDEPPLREARELVEAIREGLRDYRDVPYALFGHSMGALLAFELARSLRRDSGRQPVQVVVSGHRGPHLPYPVPPIRDLPAERFVEELRRYDGTPPDALESEELIELLLPALRADFTVCETYEYLEEEPLECPIAAYGGLRDPDVTRGDLEAWGRHTNADFIVRMFAGGHFYHQSSSPLFFQMLSRDLQRHLVSRS
jgi:medium-chain acyl-[acyl-carrier-protein] hydrolase